MPPTRCHLTVSARRYTFGMSDHWRVIEASWEHINIYDGADVFRNTYDSAPKISGLMFAAHFCQSEVCNGGFHQFFWNSTGVLAPEAIEGFRRIGQHEVAEVVETAMGLLGASYLRDRAERQERLSRVPKTALDSLDEKFFSLIGCEAGGFQKAADHFVNQFGHEQKK